jgi:hypothetical protein
MNCAIAGLQKIDMPRDEARFMAAALRDGLPGNDGYAVDWRFTICRMLWCVFASWSSPPPSARTEAFIVRGFWGRASSGQAASGQLAV